MADKVKLTLKSTGSARDKSVDKMGEQSVISFGVVWPAEVPPERDAYGGDIWGSSLVLWSSGETEY